MSTSKWKDYKSKKCFKGTLKSCQILCVRIWMIIISLCVGVAKRIFFTRRFWWRDTLYIRLIIRAGQYIVEEWGLRHRRVLLFIIDFIIDTDILTPVYIQQNSSKLPNQITQCTVNIKIKMLHPKLGVQRS